jgi:Icc-related predicted phosphoesterase
MKIIATSDVHQMISKWKDLVKVCKKEKPDVVAIAGDNFPKDTYITGQMSFMPHLVKYANIIKEEGTEIVIILGNDDNQNLIPLMEQEHNNGLWHYIPEKVANIKGYEFVAMPWVPDYPFGYKYWCRGESRNNYRIDPQQFTDPVLINTDNKFEIIKDYKAYIRSKKTIQQSLEETAKLVKDIGKSIWLIHCPPSGMDLDICSHGARVGSYEVLKFIQEQQPLLTIHGHIHESPQYNNYKWCYQEGNTLCVQGGQLGFDLHYATIEIDNGKIIKKGHSIYHDYLNE